MMRRIRTLMTPAEIGIAIAVQLRAGNIEAAEGLLRRYKEWYVKCVRDLLVSHGDNIWSVEDCPQGLGYSVVSDKLVDLILSVNDLSKYEAHMPTDMRIVGSAYVITWDELNKELQS